MSAAEKPVDISAFRDLYPFASRFVEVNGLRMHYVDEGAGEPVVMLHGNPTWSFYFRELIRGLSGSRRTIAFDHIGCGLSEKPGPRDYGFRLGDRVADFGAFIESLGVSGKITLVLHDWGGAVGAAWAVRNAGRIGRLVVLNTAAFEKPEGKPLPLALRVGRNAAWAAAPAILGLNLFARAAARTASAKGLGPRVRAALLAPYGSRRHRLATLRFVQDIPLGPGDPSWALIRETGENLGRLAGKPMLICWGGRDFVFDDDYLAEWRRRFPAAEVHRFAAAGHYVLEDAAPEILALTADFLERHPCPA
jgi:haloalkane dehalogenase